MLAPSERRLAELCGRAALYALRRRAALDRPHNLCACGAPLSTTYDLPRAARLLTRAAVQARPADLWRYHEMLPVQNPAAVVTLGEGMTPLLRLPRLRAAARGSAALPQDESLQPTNSFKARGMALAVSRAAELGLRHLAIPSAGNAGCALAAVRGARWHARHGVRP
jgi:threonine synthase